MRWDTLTVDVTAEDGTGLVIPASPPGSGAVFIPTVTELCCSFL